MIKLMKQSFLVVLVVLVALSVVISLDKGLTVSAATTLVEGSGTTDEPYLITTAAQLAAIGTGDYQLNDHYVLANDINLSDYLSASGDGYNGGFGWVPIGDSISPFSGTFDGNGHVISNLEINLTTGTSGAQSDLGLFSYSEGMIKNLGVVDASIWGYTRVGVLVGQTKIGGVIENSYATGTIEARGTKTGGLVGSN